MSSLPSRIAIWTMNAIEAYPDSLIVTDQILLSGLVSLLLLGFEVK